MHEKISRRTLLKAGCTVAAGISVSGSHITQKANAETTTKKEKPVCICPTLRKKHSLRPTFFVTL